MGDTRAIEGSGTARSSNEESPTEREDRLRSNPALYTAGYAALRRIIDTDFPIRSVPRLTDEKLRHGDRMDGLTDRQWMDICLLPRREGPSIIGPFPIRIAGAIVVPTSFFIWVENGKIVAWQDAAKLPRGGFRRGEWLMSNDGNVLEIVHDRVHKASEVERRDPSLTGRMAERHAEAAIENDRDLEHFVASGCSVSRAQHETLHAHTEVLTELIQGTFDAFSGSTVAGEDHGIGLAHYMEHAVIERKEMLGTRSFAAPCRSP